MRKQGHASPRAMARDVRNQPAIATRFLSSLREIAPELVMNRQTGTGTDTDTIRNTDRFTGTGTGTDTGTDTESHGHRQWQMGSCRVGPR